MVMISDAAQRSYCQFKLEHAILPVLLELCICIILNVSPVPDLHIDHEVPMP